MKKLLMIILTMLVATSLFADDQVKSVTDSWGETLSTDEYRLIKVRTDTDERVKIFNYTDGTDSFSVYMLWREAFDADRLVSEWVPVASSSNIEPNKRWMSQTDIDELLSNVDSICVMLAIKAESGKEYKYRVFNNSDHLCIEVYNK